MGNALLPWKTGISQEDTVRALRTEDGSRISRSRRPLGFGGVLLCFSGRVRRCAEDGIQQALVFRLVESHSASAELLLLAIPEAPTKHAFLSACFIVQALEAHDQLVDCLAATIIAAIAMLPGMPKPCPQVFPLPVVWCCLLLTLILVVVLARLEMVVNLGDEALSQRRSYSWSPPYGRREARPSRTCVVLPKYSGQDVPPPVFSFCSCLVRSSLFEGGC